MPALYAILSNHGFGHISRSSSILREFQERRPDVDLIVATTKAPELVKALFRPGLRQRAVALDTGVASSDSLSFDPARTLVEIRELRGRADDLVRAEVEFIKREGIQLVIGDIPPLAASVARAADVPCWMWGNFGWDEIWRDWGGELADEADRAAEMYAACDRLFRLPFHTDMSAFQNKIDVGVTGRPSSADPREVARRLGLDDRPVVLLAFGGLGLEQAPLENTARLPEFQFVSFQRGFAPTENLRIVNDDDLQPRDLLALADRVLSKPGYGMFSEILHCPRPFFCLEREGWAETPLLLQALRDHFSHRIVSSAEFFATDWKFLNEEAVPPGRDPLPLDGNDRIVDHLVEFFS